jgi:hypothetical protein
LRACDAEIEPPQTQELEDAGARHRATSASVFSRNHGTMTDLPDQLHTVPRVNPGLRLWRTGSEIKESGWRHIRD